MNQHTMPSMKEEGKDEHSGHSGHHWPTQPSSTLPRGKGFFARLSQVHHKQAPVAFSKPSDHEDDKEHNIEPPQKLLTRSPSLPSLKVTVPQEMEKVSLFKSPVKDEPAQCNQQAAEHHRLRRSPSLPLMQTHKNNRQHHMSPIPQHLSSRATPITKSVAQHNAVNKIYNSVAGMTPLQNSRPGLIYSSNRAPLQSITPLNHREVIHSNHIIHGSNSKASSYIDKENAMHKSKDSIMNVKAEYKEPTPDWKRDIVQQMIANSPVGMSLDNFCAKRPCAPSVPLSTKTARNLFQSDGSSPQLPENFDIFKEKSEPESSFPGNLSSKMPSQHFSTYNDTPVPMKKKYAQHSEVFEFKQPNLPQQRHKDTSDHDLVVVHGIPYRKGEKLGKGGSSDVFQVFRMGDDAEFALKVVYLKDADDTVKKGFLNEINILRKMQGCERVIQLIDFELCEEQELLFVVMERGVRDLSAFLKDRAKRKDLRVSTIEAFWRDMVEAVAAIHEQGIIHSDLKPANFILCGEVGFHQLKLIDFGIASTVQTDMTSVIKEHPAGTFNYMSPEALQGANVKINYKSDIWSLGCILYCLLYGATPFQHIKNYQQKTAAICDPNHVIEFPERSPNLLGDGVIPQTLLETVQTCLSHHPTDRPSSKELLKTKFCGCEKPKPQTPPIDILAQGLASLVREHPLAQQLAPLLMAALQKGTQ